MLRRDEDCVHTQRRVVVVVFDGDLALGIGTKVGHDFAFLANGGKFTDERVAEVERERHEVVGVIDGVAKHHALVSRTLFHRIGAYHTLVDVGALLVDGTQHAATIRVELVFAFVVSDATNDIARDTLQIHIGVGIDLAREDDLSRGDKCFDGDFGVGVLGKEVVENGVGDLVRDFVRVSFGHGFG